LHSGRAEWTRDRFLSHCRSDHVAEPSEFIISLAGKSESTCRQKSEICNVILTDDFEVIGSHKSQRNEYIDWLMDSA
jgi:hypothetical protein